MKKLLSTFLAASRGISTFAGLSASADKVSGGDSAFEERTIAFTGAEGGGMYSKGARAAENQEVYHVTNLNDSGEGSFRDAVSKSGRFVVFDVSGMIDLSKNVTIPSNTTILGQTAPGNGICIRGNNVKIGGSNIIVRYIRFRVGAHMADGSDTRAQDGLEITDNSSNIIVDHCSVSWGTDENLSAYAVKDVTIQNSIIAEALNQSVHDKGEHSYAAIWGGVNLSVHHNIIASHKSRNPKIGTSETVAMTAGYTDDQTLVDMRNNIIYNWGDKAGYGAENGANVNIINNYYKPGPATPAGKRARIFEFSSGRKYKPGWSGAVYADGNYIDDDCADAVLVNENNWQPEKGTGVYPDGTVLEYAKLDEPNTTYINDYPITTTSAQEAYEYVLANAGARLPQLDVVDARILADVRNRTGAEGSKGSVGLVDDPRDTVPAENADSYDDRGYPVWEQVNRAADYDTDGDGIPNEWELSHGLNPSNPKDSLTVAVNGRSWLEIYADAGNNNGLELTADKTDAAKGEKITFTAASKYDSNTGMQLYIDGVAYGDPDSTVNEVSLESGCHTAVVYSESTNDISNIVYIRVADGENVLANGQSAEKNITGNYKVVSTIKASQYTKGVPSYIYAGNCGVGVVNNDGYEGVICAGARDNLTATEYSAAEYPLVKIERTGSTVELFAGKNLAEWTSLGSYEAVDADKTGTAVGAAAYTYAGGTVTAEVPDGTTVIAASYNTEGRMTGAKTAVFAGGKAEVGEVPNAKLMFVKSIKSLEPVELADMRTVSDFSQTYFVTGATAPTAEIIEPADGERIGYDAEVIVDVRPDGAPISQLLLYFNNELKNTLNVNITDAERVSIPVSFDSMANGTLRVTVVDTNLCLAQSEITAYISADPAPWQIEDIGSTDSKTFINVTPDYTYKISAPEGYIGGSEDKCGYVYQQFTGDNRLYYRSRMQSGSQFGIMLRTSLEPDADMYWFGGEYNADGNEKLTYDLKHRENGTVTLDEVIDNQQANLYFIAEKAGNTLNIYQTENGATVYTTKTLLASIDCSNLGDTYYMGFAAVGGAQNPSDAGWVAIDNNSGDDYYKWGFDNGLDWLWQMQESNVLRPSWTVEDVTSEEESGGKMKLEANDDYTSERYVFREYIMDNSLMPEVSLDFCVTGENPAMNIYFQTGDASKAYKAVIDEGILTSVGYTLGTAETSKWYTLNIRTDMTVDGVIGYATLTTKSGEVLAADIPIEQVTGTEFREQINTAKKTPVTKAVYFEPKAGSEGAYYIDNVEIRGNEPSVKVTKTESWYSFAGLPDGAFTEPITINGVTEAGGTVTSGESATVSAGEIKDSTKTKSVDGVSFKGKCRIKETGKKIPVPASEGAVVSVYAASASSSAERPLFINGQQYDIKAAVRSDYTCAEGES